MSIHQIEEQQHPIALSNLDNLADKAVKGTAVNRYGLAGPQGSGLLHNDAAGFALPEGCDEAGRQKSWGIAVSND